MRASPVYFAYGSNLSAGVRAESGLGELSYVARAWLPDRALRFRRRTGRGTGALDVAWAPGAVVPGAIFRCTPGAWQALDTKEGFDPKDEASSAYRRVTVRVLDAHGRHALADTYVVVSPERYVPPSSDYVRRVAEGQAELGVDGAEALAAAAGDRPAPAGVAGCFVYGTLLPGGELHPLVARWVERALPASTRGRLYDLGWYPGLLPPRRGDRGRVRGALLVCSDLPGFLEVADGIEGFRGHDATGSLFRRILVRARDIPGRPLAWAYVYGRTPQGDVLPAGDWRACLASRMVTGGGGARRGYPPRSGG
jgi:gamma-glutamylcyclotransferase (GGCT)/AIG2-like uncharacterized protein YtfP